jgi:hypothetical protein
MALALVALVVVRLGLHFTHPSPASIRRYGCDHLQSSYNPATVHPLHVS